MKIERVKLIAMVLAREIDTAYEATKSHTELPSYYMIHASLSNLWETDTKTADFLKQVTDIENNKFLRKFGRIPVLRKIMTPITKRRKNSLKNNAIIYKILHNYIRILPDTMDFDKYMIPILTRGLELKDFTAGTLRESIADYKQREGMRDDS